MDNTILLHLCTSGTWIRTQVQCRRLICQWQHGPAHCTFLQTAGPIRHITIKKTKEMTWTCLELVDTKKTQCFWECTYPRASDISSNWAFWSGCPFSAGFILYCSWATWFSWLKSCQDMLDFLQSLQLKYKIW